jgi:hypothetical protein
MTRSGVRLSDPLPDRLLQLVPGRHAHRPALPGGIQYLGLVVLGGRALTCPDLGSQQDQALPGSARRDTHLMLGGLV